MSTPAARQFVFISYASANRELVDRLAADLKARGVQFWIDKEGLKPGMPNWELAIRDALNQSAVLLYMVAPESLVSNPVKGELAIAQMLGRPILPIWIRGDQWANAAQLEYISAQRIDARPGSNTNALDQIIQVFEGYISGKRQSAPAIAFLKPPTFEPRNPYKGLKAFSEADKDDFFGRDDLIGDLLADVEAMKETRFLAVIGASGSGKSSVVRAPGPSPTPIPPSITPPPRPTKSSTATATILISTLARTLPVWTPIASPTARDGTTPTPTQ
jgi:hypothetical protein